MNVLILHGIGGHGGVHWGQWLHDQLVERGYQVVMPTLSASDHPDRATWLAEARRMISGVDPAELIIVGHSLGVTTALDIIEQAPTKIKGLASVSGFSYDYGAELNGYFLREKIINFDQVRMHLSGAAVLYGDNDPYVTQEALHDLALELHVKPYVVSSGGHLNTDSGFTTFPQLLNMVLALDTGTN